MKKVGGKDSQDYEIRHSALHFEGVFACKPVDKGSLVFGEHPDVCMQSNRLDVVACANCHHFIGTTSTQLDLITQKINRGDLQSQFEAANAYGGKDDGSPKAPGNVLAFPGDLILTEKTCLCRDKCGELYCSPSCEAANWERGHDLMCTGKRQMGDPLVEFKQFAVETNEIFLLVGELFAKLCKEVATAIAMVPPELVEETKKEVCGQYDSFNRNLWWDVAVDPADPPEKQKQLKEGLQMMVGEAWLYLSATLDLQSRGLADLLNEEYIARTIGMFEQNNVGVHGPSPVASFAMSMLSTDPGISDMAKACKIVNDQFSGDSEDDEEYYSEEEEADDDDDQLKLALEQEAVTTTSTDLDEDVTSEEDLQIIHNILGRHGIDSVFPPFDGTSFYKTICKMNHSCAPNVRVTYAYEAPGAGLVARVTTLRPIKDGEELFISYINENEPREKRREALRDYGFECTCEKCEAESSRSDAFDRTQADIDPEVQSIKEFYNLQDHPEGGYFAEMYRSDVEVVSSSDGTKRSASTGIVFLITQNSVSRLHRIKSDEMWHFYGGGPLCVVELDEKTKTCKKTIIGPHFMEGERVQYVVQRDVWFGSFPLPTGENNEYGYSLVGCTVAPGFEFEDFELANRSALLEDYTENEDACKMIEKLCIGL